MVNVYWIIWLGGANNFYHPPQIIGINYNLRCMYIHFLSVIIQSCCDTEHVFYFNVLVQWHLRVENEQLLYWLSYQRQKSFWRVTSKQEQLGWGGGAVAAGQLSPRQHTQLPRGRSLAIHTRQRWNVSRLRSIEPESGLVCVRMCMTNEHHGSWLGSQSLRKGKV